MSNQLLGTVYLRIMDEVIENCQTTFEEDGVSQQTLEDLKSTWQSKLSALKVGTFPWEPPPAPQPMANPTPVPSNVPRQSGLPSNGGPAPSVPSKSEPRIKTEPGYEPNVPKLPPDYANNDARQRAAALLQQKFGSEANAQINKIQSEMIGNAQSRPPLTSPRPGTTPEQQREQQAEYQRRQHEAMYRQMQQARQYPAAGAARTDAQKADMSIRQQIEQSHRANEGGGLMAPLSEQSSLPQAKRRRLDAEIESSDSAAAPKIPQTDGPDDDDEDSKTNIKDELFEDDDDAINSDLDDPDENEIEEEAEDGKPTQVMLCTYDKVQRVKNKWKCTLRDGVLNSGGKEYVFGKANGEFEW